MGIIANFALANVHRGHRQACGTALASLSMKTIYLDDNTAPQEPCVATIGFFDGVHRGHQFLISRVRHEAAECGLRSLVVTFDRHPRQVLSADYQPELLSTLDTKLMLLSQTGVDATALLHFDKHMASLSARDFMEQVLRNKLGVRRLIIGYDNRFGHNRAEGFDDYVRYGRELGMEVVHNEAYTLDGIQVSSSVVRALVKEGEVDLANRCLGYPYTIAGTVVSGHQEGRRMGFPTANLDTANFGQLVPGGGVYAVKVRLEHSKAFRPAMMNIGTRPTFGGTTTSLEVHIFNFNENIYGRMMLVSFEHRIREERKFDNVTMLVEQLKDDEKMVEQYFENNHNHE